jgi:hypothetical protein
VACTKYHVNLIAYMISHPLIAALYGVFCLHRPLILSPDIIRLTLTQGLARNINQNAGKLCRRFVSPEGKVKISVHRDDFIKGSSENPWPEVFPAFVVYHQSRWKQLLMLQAVTLIVNSGILFINGMTKVDHHILPVGS